MKLNQETYEEFLQRKQLIAIDAGHESLSIPSFLFDFQRDIVAWAIRRGRAAIFADCGLGKTPMQLVWANEVVKHTSHDVLILAPLAVSKQTVNEGKKFGIAVTPCRTQADVQHGINITNYEMVSHFDCNSFGGVVLDESSILKNYSGHYRTLLIESCQDVPYLLACTATPSPNDHTELGNHAEFLRIMTRQEMLSMFFINDSGDTGTWRLKGHAQNEFWKWVCSWAVLIRKPSDLGYEDRSFCLPSLHVHEHALECQKPLSGTLFHRYAETLSERRQVRRETIIARCEQAAELANKDKDQWLIWCDLNDESALLTQLIDGAVEVKGADSVEHKEWGMNGFAAGDIRVLVSKPKIAGFGMNFQSCHNMAFVGLSDSYEAYYQAVRRCWRFGQESPVNAHIITAELEGNVVANIRRKEADAVVMAQDMVHHMAHINEQNIHGGQRQMSEYKENKKVGNGWELWLGDSVKLIEQIQDGSVHYSIFSPPFASLFTYSNSERDMGNCKSSDEFQEHFQFLSQSLYRVMMAGRLLSFHVMNTLATITHDGFIGMKDFRGDLIRVFQEAGFIYHSEVCIWKDPLVQATRTKVLTLAHKQISKDSSRCGQGFPDYIVTMRKPGANPEPISHGRGFERYAGEREDPTETKTDDPRTNKYSHQVWQRYASPVWFDIRQTVTLNSVKSEKDERHICPLQLDTIDRCLDLWSNPGDLVFSPFAGIGSEGYQAIKMGRRFIGIELKPEYFNVAVKNMLDAETHKDQGSLFGSSV